MEYIPHNYQSYCTERVVNEKALGLFLDMGLGKTVITLTAINELRYNRFEVSRVLVIAPKRVAETTWAREAKKWDHLNHLRIVPILGDLKKRVRALYTPGDIWVINRENVQWLVAYTRNEWPFDMVVCDEFSSFKNHAAKRFKSLTYVRDKIDRFVGLTGTPAPNGLLDLWAQLYLLDQGERLGKKITHFRERYFDYNPYNMKYKPKFGSDGTIRDLIGDICVSMKSEDYLELPECIYTDVPVILDPPALKKYKELELEAILELEDTVINAGTAAVLTGKLLQLCNGAVYDSDRRVMEVHNCKIEAFLELVEGLNGQPALVFTAFQHDTVRLQASLRALGLNVREMQGPKDEADWNAGKIDILLAHPASAGHGLNLQDGGRHIIWFSAPWALELYQQANKRLHRQGQKNTVFVHHLVVEGGVDEDVLAAIHAKSDVQEQLLVALKAKIEKYKEEK